MSRSSYRCSPRRFRYPICVIRLAPASVRDVPGIGSLAGVDTSRSYDPSAIGYKARTVTRFWKRFPSCARKIRRGSESLLALLRLRPHDSLPTLVDLDVNYVRPTADGVVLDILLGRARRCIDGYYDFFAAGIADIARIAPHGDDSNRTMAET